MSPCIWAGGTRQHSPQEGCSKAEEVVNMADLSIQQEPDWEGGPTSTDPHKDGHHRLSPVIQGLANEASPDDSYPTSHPPKENDLQYLAICHKHE